MARICAIFAILAVWTVSPSLSRAESAAPSAAQVQGEGALASALTLLLSVPSGRRLAEHAVSAWNLEAASELISVGALRSGTASRTDAVLTRRFNPVSGAEVRERQITVYLRTDLGIDELVLDLAHELVHATSRPAWDPYDPALTASRYISAAIEGQGGEVEAVISECQVARELVAITGATPAARARCKDYWGPDGIRREAIREDFYRVGRWQAQLEKALGPGGLKLFPLLSTAEPRLYSSTGNAPYPIALLREFQEITEIACENSRRRIEAREQAAPSRSPASGPDNGAGAETRQFLSQRCR